MTTLTIGENVKKIAAKAFINCRKLNTINFKGKKAPTIGKQAFKGMKTACKVNVLKAMPAKQLKKLKAQLKKGKVGKKAKYYKKKKIK